MSPSSIGRSESGYWLNISLAGLISLAFAFFHIQHLQDLFENSTFFSHLSDLERELSFRTENGLYYSYYKQLVSTESGLTESLVNNLLHDNRTEHPNTINTLQRFNLYPELILASIYRFANHLGLLEQECWQVDRSKTGLSSVQACMGNQVPVYFYVNSVFYLHGLSMMFLFFLCWSINNRSLTSGILACSAYIFNHGEATRVMWTPPLRESFSFPFHMLQLISLLGYLRSATGERFLTLSTLVYMLPWQFAQFDLSTQTLAVFGAFAIRYLTRPKLLGFIRAQTIALCLCFILMFGNRMLVTSLHASLLAAVWSTLLIEHVTERFIASSTSVSIRNILDKFKSTCLGVLVSGLVRVIVLLGLVFVFKKHILTRLFDLIFMSKSLDDDDSHIWHILKSKFNTSYYTFDSRLYTCAAEFDFLDSSYFVKLCYTLLVPMAAIIFIYYSLVLLKRLIFHTRSLSTDFDRESVKDECCMLVNLLQTVAYIVMACLIMRLKLFLTPHLCILASYLGNKHQEYNIWERSLIRRFKSLDKSQLRFAIAGLLVALMAFQGVQNVMEQHNMESEFSNPPLEALMTWINQKTRLNAAFAGSMALMANVKLSTNRPIVNHPHYEDFELRNRTKHLYSYLYGYQDVKDLHRLLKHDLKATYLVLEPRFCKSHPPDKPHCALTELAQIEFKKNSANRACEVILAQSDPTTRRLFKSAFSFKDMIHVYQLTL